MNEPLPIICFSDVLCVFAYAANARFEQLHADFGEEVCLTQHFISVYGDVRRRFERMGKSGEEYGKDVLDIAKRFDHIKVHPEVFHGSYPVSSIPAHLYLRAVKLLEDEGVIEAAFVPMIWDVRVAFFRDLVDISKREHLDAIAEQHGVPIGDVTRLLESGRAHAEFDNDVRLQRDFNVQVSPSLVLNDGRQHLNGNVGYRLIEANVRELLHKPAEEMSWC
jgi:predicted DsbA family dithiol-disulfide isomerase